MKSSEDAALEAKWNAGREERTMLSDDYIFARTIEAKVREQCADKCGAYGYVKQITGERSKAGVMPNPVAAEQVAHPNTSVEVPAPTSPDTSNQAEILGARPTSDIRDMYHPGSKSWFRAEVIKQLTAEELEGPDFGDPLPHADKHAEDEFEAMRDAASEFYSLSSPIEQTIAFDRGWRAALRRKEQQEEQR